VELESPEAARRRGVEDDEAYRFGRPPEDLPSIHDAVPTRETDFGTVRIEKLDLANKKERARFIECADQFYEGDPNYIAPLRMHLMRFLDPKQNPAFESLDVQAFIAVKNGAIAGRITAHYDRNYSRYHETETGFFGFFESANDKKVAHALFAAATDWCRARNCVEIFGPMNFTMSHQVGLLVENFDRPPFIEETYNPRYYLELYASYGLAKAKDWLVWWIDIHEGMETENRRRIAKIAERIKKREGLTLRHIDLSKPEEEIKKLYVLYMACWQKNWSFVPLSEKEFAWLAQDFKQVAIPEMVLFIEVEGKTVGFSATLPNVNERLPKDGKLFPFAWTKLLFGGLKKAKAARLYTLGMLPEYRKRGLESLLLSETLMRGKKLGFIGGEIGMTLEDNTLINRAIESMDGRRDRTYRIYGLRL
jgi:GNAT superfamily N-acetyltransferase